MSGSHRGTTGGPSKQKRNDQQLRQLNEINSSFIEMKFAMKKKNEKCYKSDKHRNESIEIRLGGD